MPEEKHAKDYCAAEIMAAFLSKDLKDGELGLIGTFSQIPWTACRLAQARHAPSLWFCIGTAGAVNSNFDKLLWYVGDYRIQIGAESRISTDTIIDMQGNPRFADFGFYGGFQIDKYGNLNMAYVGDQKKPRFRGPGTVGTMATAWLNRVYIFTHFHTPRLLVEKVDFVSGPGFLDGPKGREKAGSPSRSEGPRYVVTPIAVFDFDEETKIMRLKSVHPGHTVEEVKQRTGFTPVIPAKVPETEPPTVEELAFMRKFDPDGIMPRLTQ
ncbi:MAG: CoA-transferase [Dehalococcoidia bacterium]|nr:CoA-transferase [Dehalococcoidia bacterium]